MAALAAPLIFCLTLEVLTFPLRFFGFWLSTSFLIGVAVVSALVGAITDLERLPNFMGNIFLTNPPEDRNYRVFCIYWCCVIGAAIICGRFAAR